MTRARRLAGTMPYAACFTLGSEDRKYSVSTSTVKNEKKPDSDRLAGAEDTAEDAAHEVAVGDSALQLGLELVDHLVVGVEVADQPVVRARSPGSVGALSASSVPCCTTGGTTISPSDDEDDDEAGEDGGSPRTRRQTRGGPAPPRAG